MISAGMVRFTTIAAPTLGFISIVNLVPTPKSVLKL